MHYFIDGDFVERNGRINLVSLAIAAENDREYYGQSVEYDERLANPWMRKHVLPHLHNCGCWPQSPKVCHQTMAQLDLKHNADWLRRGPCPWRALKDMRQEVEVFLDPAQYGDIHLWGHNCSHLFVAFCQIWGSLEDLPAGFPRRMGDLALWDELMGNTVLPARFSGPGQPQPLLRARWNKLVWERFVDYEIGRRDRLADVLAEGLDGEGPGHKQWSLWEIAGILKPYLGPLDVATEDKGIAP